MFIFEKAPFSSCHASTLVETAPGKLLAAWFGGRAEGARDVKIWAADFDGKTWTEPRAFAEEPGQPCWNPVLFLAGKELVLNYKAGPSPQTWSGFQKRSTDAGATWSEPVLLLAGVYGPIKDKPILVSDGALLAGTSVESHKAWCSWVNRSTDGAKTWTRHGPIDVPEKPNNLIQPTLLEVEPKRIVALCRARNIGFICQAESRDAGLTWGDAKPTDLPNPNSGIDAVRTDKGDCFLIYNHTNAGRFPLNLAWSSDQGKSWKKVATVEEQIGEFSYPAIIQASDGKLHATYTWNRSHIKYLTFDPAKLRA
jgi:predicted neuraminidase